MRSGWKNRVIRAVALPEKKGLPEVTLAEV